MFTFSLLALGQPSVPEAASELRRSAEAPSSREGWPGAPKCACLGSGAPWAAPTKSSLTVAPRAAEGAGGQATAEAPSSRVGWPGARECACLGFGAPMAAPTKSSFTGESAAMAGQPPKAVGRGPTSGWQGG